MDISIRAITPQCSADIEASASASTFWEFPAGYGNGHQSCDDPSFDKQIWLQKVLMEWGICGYTAFVGTGDAGTRQVPAATVFFAPARYMQGIEKLPTAPISPDAILLSTVHVALPYMGLYLEHQLIDTVITEAHRRGIKAIESFARVEELDEELMHQLEGAGAFEARDLSASNPVDDTAVEKAPKEYSALESLKYVPESYRGWEAGTETPDPDEDVLDYAPMLSEDILEAEGFKVVRNHSTFPRYRLEIGGSHSLFGDFAEEDHVQVNGPERLSTVIGGKQASRPVGNLLMRKLFL